MQARDAMTTSVATIAHEATVREAVKLKLQRGVSALPVLGLDGADDPIVITLQSAVRQPLTRINRSLLPDARVATRR
jgi:CBS domain-containing protein